jgi:hypothetical protein
MPSSVVSKFPHLGWAILWATSRDEAITVENLASIGRCTAIERTAHFFLELSERLRLVGLAQATEFACVSCCRFHGHRVQVVAAHVEMRGSRKVPLPRHVDLFGIRKDLMTEVGRCRSVAKIEDHLKVGIPKTTAGWVYPQTPVPRGMTVDCRARVNDLDREDHWRTGGFCKLAT